MAAARSPNSPLYLRVAEIRQETEHIRSYRFTSLDGSELPPFTAGAHIGIIMPGRITRYYSLCSTPDDKYNYVIGIQREMQGRGGSRLAHELLKVGKMVKIQPPRNFFELAPSGKHLLISGGIGVTPMLAMAAALNARGQDYHLVICTRGRPSTPFSETVDALVARKLASCHDGTDAPDFHSMLREVDPDRHLYCCGSPKFMDAVRAACAHWPGHLVHFESFSPVVAREGDTAFSVHARQSRITFTVAADQTILQALRANGVSIDSVCENGTCGTCMVPLVSGDVDHRDSVLSTDQRCANLMACVSRAISPQLTLEI